MDERAPEVDIVRTDGGVGGNGNGDSNGNDKSIGCDGGELVPEKLLFCVVADTEDSTATGVPRSQLPSSGSSCSFVLFDLAVAAA
eukprot:CAMPEP_0201233580 /NCGR_PEP_ID=MMETSP0852-20130820/5418_1 /ASSEMBLY_ACC=CAM_ASM_000632 /TAXON_ID=183588 /ORGANISM="Pseudo-nitzschia fraudulenta, Strain WWA7" /LENGTH=84 /DNA_ID=CAMNT_0047526527 /DNA_START=79 /DNA_END=331 /DNA_ORIENTATION=-